MALLLTTRPRRWFIYRRISDDPGHDELGVRRQLHEIRDLAQRLGGEIVDEFKDDDISAYSGKRRPRYEAMLERLEAGEADGILAWHPDRLHRNNRELEDFIDLLNRTGAVVQTVTAGEYDLSTAAGRMTARVVGSVARHESEHKSERIRAKVAELHRDGKYTHGWRYIPFGYRQVEEGKPDLRIEPAEADVIRDLADRYLAGEGLLSLRRDLERRGIPTVTGSGWTSTTIKHMLTRPLIAGLRRSRDSQGLEVAPWPAIIEEETHHRLVARAKQSKQAGRRFPRKYLLRGTVRCGACGAPLEGVTVRTAKGERAIYRCRSNGGGCGAVQIGAEPTDRLVADAVIARIDAKDFRGRLERAQGRPSGVGEERKRLEERLNTLADMLADGEMDRASYGRAVARVQSHLEGLRSREQEQSTYSPLDRWAKGGLGAAWEGLSLDQRRAVVSAMLTHVEINPLAPGREPRFDPARVEISGSAWRA